MIRSAALALALALGSAAGTAAPALAQQAATQPDAATLADLRGQLHQLTDQLQALRAELVASGAEGFQAAGGDSAIDRMNAMEAQLSRLTGQSEQLQNRIQRIVREATRQLDDLEFRLCEMDSTCDLGALMTKPAAGSGAGGASTGPAIGNTRPPTSGEAAGEAPSSAEQQDFDRAKEVLGQGDFLRAAELFAAAAKAHAGGPLTAEALFMRGSALDSAGQPEQAAAAWLEAFAADPQGRRSAESLLGISRVLTDHGDPTSACFYLSEIPVRFAGSDFATEAERRMQTLDCGAGEMPAGDPEAAADLAGDE